MPLLLLAFIVVPLIELFVIIQVGQAIGVLPTIFLIFLSGALGAILLRSQGIAVWRRFNEALGERRVPHREVLDGVLVIFGGALLLTPGFVTDVFGLALLAPPSRASIRSLMSKLLVGRVALGGRVAYWGFGKARERRQGTGASAPGTPPPPADAPPRPAEAPPRPAGSSAYDVEGSAQEVRDEGLIEPPPPPPPPPPPSNGAAR